MTITIKEAMEYLKDPTGKSVETHIEAVNMAVAALEQKSHICSNCGHNVWLKNVQTGEKIRPYCVNSLKLLKNDDYCSFWKPMLSSQLKEVLKK